MNKKVYDVYIIVLFILIFVFFIFGVLDYCNIYKNDFVLFDFFLLFFGVPFGILIKSNVKY